MDWTLDLDQNLDLDTGLDLELDKSLVGGGGGGLFDYSVSPGPFF